MTAANNNNNNIGKPERVTQNRVVQLFREQLGYDYLGDWQDRADNSNIEVDLLTAFLEKQGKTPEQISRAIQKLKQEAGRPDLDLYHRNKAVYELLRYGVKVKTDAGEVTETIPLVDWAEPQNNDFAIAEEVTLRGGFERRPDLVLYINGIAIGVIELKRSSVGLGEGIGQLLSNQTPRFNEWFFSTVQLTFAGNDSEGLQYGTILTPRKYYLTWKEDEDDNSGYKLDKYLVKMCAKERLIDILHNFILFDGGVKKVPRVHQYFGIKAAQEHVVQKKGGIIWHTQGSGKSIVMVLLAKWILENNPNARVAIITDRDELDKQIERVFTDAGEQIERTDSQRDLVLKLGQATPRLLCSLVHKFGQRGVETEAEVEAFVKEMKGQHITHGEVFVFVDECHRTQSGKLHQFMQALMPEAVYIGFTGTPLLKRDKATSVEVFGSYIHTYKFDEAVADNVVLDLQYEARDIEQKLSSESKVDEWFEAKTKGLNDWQKAELKARWGSMQAVLSSSSRIDQIVMDVVHDFGVKARLSNERGNAMLVAKSIFEASLFYEAFQKTELKGKVGLITSYEPHQSDISREEDGTNSPTDKKRLYETYETLLENVTPVAGKTAAKTYEDEAKKLFTKEPAQMKLLVVVDKLLTGFDAPSCTYLYIDKNMQDHGLFQALCRTNRLDGDDKDFGYIVDYMNLLEMVEDSISVYTTELDDEAGKPDILLKDRLERAKKRLDAALETIEYLCEPVPQPKGELEYIQHFCGNTEKPADLEEHRAEREVLYTCAATLVRAYAALSAEMEEAGYSKSEAKHIDERVDFYAKLRATIKLAAGETLDIKAYEADMRHLIDTYIKAEETRTISNFDEDTGLLELVAKLGVKDAVKQSFGKEINYGAAGAAVVNNIRAKIIREHMNNPAFYDRMSLLLDEVIKHRNEKAEEYEEYLEKLRQLATQIEKGFEDDTPEPLRGNAGVRAIYDNLGALAVGDEVADVQMAQKLHQIVLDSRPNQWRASEAKQNRIKAALFAELKDQEAVEALFAVIFEQENL